MLVRLAARVAALLGAAATVVAAQTREVTGRVTEAGSGTPLTQASVGVLGSPLVVRTNDRGEYRLRAASGPVTILARAIGFKRASVNVATGQATADFALDKDVLELEGVTVNGQATTIDRRNATTAVATVSSEDLLRAPAKSIEGNFAGKVLGATVYENNGAPGGGMQVKIRGTSSILGSGDPLYVVDGVIVSNASISNGAAVLNGSSSGTGTGSSADDQMVNRLADINPNDVENIEVLKSAAATAIYGSRATNGVVLITTRKGREGPTRFNVTQRIGTQRPLRLLGARKFDTYDEVKPRLGGSPQADSVARANCTPACPQYDWQGQLYGNTDPSFETMLSANGGSAATRFYGSLNDRLSHGILINTGARLTSGRLNIDQSVGDKLTLTAGLTASRNFTQNGVGGNNNNGTNPMYWFAYEPAIYDIRQIDPTTGRPVRMFMAGGGSTTINPIDFLQSAKNNEETWRQLGTFRANYPLIATVQNNVQVSYSAGVDRFQLEGNQYEPTYLQNAAYSGFSGVSQILSADSRFINQGVNAIWTYTPGWKRLNSLQTSVGGTYETQRLRTFSYRNYGLVPAVERVSGGVIQQGTDSITEFHDQSHYINEQIIAFDEKLSLAAGLRTDRSSANGDRLKYYTFPKFSASYRLTQPLRRFTSNLDEVKVRASFGKSGNRPLSPFTRDVTIASGGVIGNQGSLTASAGLGNPAIKPEVMNEQEYGVDATLFHGRASLELTHYERIIKDLLVSFPLPASSGLTSQIVNGGQMSTRGFEGGLSIVPISTPNLEWTFRAIYQHNVQVVDKLTVPSFGQGGLLGAFFGHAIMREGDRPTWLWANSLWSCVNTTNSQGQLVVNTGADGLPCHQVMPGETAPARSVVRDSVLGDANPIHQTSFTNTIRFKRFTVSGLLDWRNGGSILDLTKQLWDDGGNARDYDDPSPTPGQTLGQFRVNAFNSGNNVVYVDNGSYVKLREVTVSFEAPRRLAELVRARDLRVSLQGRNLAIWTKYWGSDPEFQWRSSQVNFGRFVDVAEYPSSRQFHISFDFGY